MVNCFTWTDSYSTCWFHKCANSRGNTVLYYRHEMAISLVVNQPENKWLCKVCAVKYLAWCRETSISVWYYPCSFNRVCFFFSRCLLFSNYSAVWYTLLPRSINHKTGLLTVL